MSTQRIFDVASVRQDFPILHQSVHGKPLVYFDNAATAQKPMAVLAAMQAYYESINSNVHRGAHTLSDTATAAFENVRQQVARFLGAREAAEIIWVRGTTEAINLVAQSYGRSQLKPGDEILVSQLEHHSNIVPWQMVAAQTGASVIPIPVNAQGEIDQTAYAGLLSPRTRILAVNHVSNALGTINPVKAMIAQAKAVGAITVIDGAQATPHVTVDVQDLDCDFYAFSGHKVYGPTGIGALYGRRAILEAIPPWQGGGEMIERVSFEGTTFNHIPHKFEAGTPAIAEVIGLGAALDYLQAFNTTDLHRHEQALLRRAVELSEGIEGFQAIGTAANKVSVCSFVVEGTHPSDLGTLLDHQGFAVRTGHHCTQPLMARFGVPGTVRASFSFYNTLEEVDRFFVALDKCIRMCR
ncbi:MAG: cysteine desulfurase [Hahellaceae bacterium]|nr:cysteine desulfurase [Hahellaceae bacterium]